MANSNDEQKKLRLEIKVLKDGVKEIRKKNKKNAFYKRLIKDFNLSTILIIVTILVSAGGFYYQSQSFIEEKKKENEIKVEAHMLLLMKGLKGNNISYEVKDANRLLLTQYKLNAIPVLLLHLKYNAEDYDLVKGSLVIIKDKVNAKRFRNAIFDNTYACLKEMLSLKFERNEPVEGLRSHLDLLKDFNYSGEQYINDSLTSWYNQVRNIKLDISCSSACKSSADSVLKTLEINFRIEHPNNN